MRNSNCINFSMCLIQQVACVQSAVWSLVSEVSIKWSSLFISISVSAVWIMEPEPSTWRFHPVRLYWNLMEKVVSLDFYDFYYLCKLRTCRMKPQMALYQKGEDHRLYFAKYLWWQRKETSHRTEGILRLASNEAWGIRRNVDVTPVTLECKGH